MGIDITGMFHQIGIHRQTCRPHYVKVPCNHKNQTFGLSESDFTICPSSEGVWFYTLSPGQNTSWTERLLSEFCTNPWKLKSQFLFFINGQHPLGRPLSYVYVKLNVLFNNTLWYIPIIKLLPPKNEHTPALSPPPAAAANASLTLQGPHPPSTFLSPWHLPLNCILLPSNCPQKLTSSTRKSLWAMQHCTRRDVLTMSILHSMIFY